MTRLIVGAVLASVLGASACDANRKELKEWTPADHHNAKSAAEDGPTRAAPVPRSAAATATPPSAPPLEDGVLLATWKNNCSLCHGLTGRGDGPQGPMLKSRDLTDPVWQASVTDAQIATSILKGRDKMPAFSFPEKTLVGLVALIRSMNRAPLQGAAGAAGSTGAGSVPAAQAPSGTGGASPVP